MSSNYQTFVQARQFLWDHRTDYEAAVQGFQWPHFTYFNWALDYFDPMAAGNERPALIIAHEDGHLESRSFAALSQRSSQLANYLQAQGAQTGDRVLLMLPNITPLWEVLLACIKLGVVVIPATTLLTAEDVADRIARGQVKHVITDYAGTEKTPDVKGLRLCCDDSVDGWLSYDAVAEYPVIFTPAAPTPADSPMLLYFTSGTTAQPKLVMHTHQSYPIGHLSTLYWIGLQRGDVHLNISSPGWAKHAWSNFFAPWNAEATVVATHHHRFDAAKVLHLLEQAQITTLCAPPTVWRLLIQHDLGAAPSHLREVVSAGEPLNPEVIAQVQQAWGIAIREGYGQTETTCQMGITPAQAIRPGSMGRPLPGYPMALLDGDGQPQDEGEVAIALNPHPLPLMAGYADDPERSHQALGGTHYRTGDVASRDADGYFWYVGRADDVFKSSDYRISPFELESVLIEHPAVVEAAVVPSPDPLRMSVPKAYVVLAAGFEPNAGTALEIFRYTRAHLAPYKRIRRLAFADLPKTISGKIRRVELRKHEAELRQNDQRGEYEFVESDFPELTT